MSSLASELAELRECMERGLISKSQYETEARSYLEARRARVVGEEAARRDTNALAQAWQATVKYGGEMLSEEEKTTLKISYMELVGLARPEPPRSADRGTLALSLSPEAKAAAGGQRPEGVSAAGDGKKVGKGGRTWVKGFGWVQLAELEELRATSNGGGGKRRQRDKEAEPKVSARTLVITFHSLRSAQSI